MRKAIIGITAALLVVAGAFPARANVESDSVVTPGVVGACFVVREGSTTTVHVVVAAPGSISLSATCHVTQATWWGERHYHVGAVGVPGGAAGSAALTGWDPAPYEVCLEIHASFLTGPPYHKSCH